MDKIAGFLRTVAPFDTLEDEELETVAAACEVESFPAGATIIVQGVEPSAHAWVIHGGAVELKDDGRLVDLLGVGEMFGHRSMITRDPVALTVTASDETICYRIPEDALRPVLARPTALRYLVLSSSGRYELDPREAASRADSVARSVGDLVRSGVVVCEPGTPIREAAQRMVEAGSAVVLVDLGDALGIVTDSDLRTRVVAAGASLDTAVAEVMTTPVRTVTADRSGTEVLLEMLDLGLRHLPVLGAHRDVVGVISDTDLLAAETRTPFHLRSAISHARDEKALCEVAARLPEAVIALCDARVAANTVSGVLTSAHDALTRRLIELAEADLGPPPAPYTWFALGSFARREAFPDSDQDNAIAWDGRDDDPVVIEWMTALAERVVGGLERAGIPACAGGAIASKRLFARSIEAWEQVTRSWLDDPDQEKALILVNVVVEGRAVWGGQIAGERLSAAFAEARSRPRLLRLLESFSLAHRPPTGFFRDFVVEHDGAHRGKLDIKHGGLLPIVDLARSAALAAGVAAASTPARLDVAEAGGTIAPKDVGVLRDAFDLITDLRLQHQVQQLRNGEAPDNHIDPSALSPLARSYLKEAFRAVARLQKGLMADMRTGMPTG